MYFFVDFVVRGNEAIQKRGRAGTSVPDMMGALLWLAAFCVSFWVCLVFFFSSVVIFTFLLSLLHHNETFSTNIHTDPVVVQ